MSLPFPAPTQPIADRAEVFLGYLDYFRAGLLEKAQALPEAERRRSRLPSGWTPLELVKHLTYVELRWLAWGFEGADVPDPWGDQRDDRWHVNDTETAEELFERLREQGEQTRRVVHRHDLTEVGQPGPRWDGEPPPPLERILFHLVQEYARHLGHLDIVAELAGTAVGE